MSSENRALTRNEEIATGRLWWVGLLAAVSSVIVNAIVVLIARGLFNVPPEFAPFSFPQFTFLTVVGVVGAVIVFAIVGRFARRPTRTFTRIAVVVLALSWLPDFGILAGKPFPGTTVQSVGTLMFMHIVTAAITVGLLTRLAREES